MAPSPDDSPSPDASPTSDKSSPPPSQDSSPPPPAKDEASPSPPSLPPPASDKSPPSLSADGDKSNNDNNNNNNDNDNNNDNGNGNGNGNGNDNNTNNNADNDNGNGNGNGNSNDNGNDSDNGNKAPPPPPPTSGGATPQSPPANNGANGDTKAVPVPPTYKSPPSAHGSPPPTRLAPPSHEKSTTTTSSDASPSDSNVSVPMNTIIGITVGSVLFIFLLLAVALVCTKRKKKRNYMNNQMQYNAGGHGYYNGTSPQEHHAINVLTPPPGAMGGAMPPHGGWQSSPQLGHSLPLNNSAEMTSSNFSGTHGPALPPPPPPTMTLGMNQSSFTFEDLAAATQGFAQSNLLGQGGFGYVHKGVLPNGKVIAVKSLKSGSGQGDREFQAEVDIISRVHHRHLVTLEGFCLAQGSKMLVYEFISNKTLEYHLHDKGHTTMDWETRLKIALGAAKGLAYLHEDCHPRIIHRDIKSANILIDDCFEAKVADFGLAKLTQDNNTHVSTRVMGTFGYLAPEYAASGKLTEKSDVFSFGVVLLELITGRRPLDMSGEMDESLVDWARPLCTEAIERRNCDQLADRFLENNYNHNEMIRMVQCAAAAIRHSARRRPKMRQIVRALEDDVPMDDLSDGAVVRAEQGSNYSSRSGGSTVVPDDETGSYSVDMRKLITSKNNSYESSEFGQTSEYGLNPSSSSSSELGDNTSRSTLS